MKIVITGHTQGIGQQLYYHWKEQEHEVVGLSRSTGHDFEVHLEEIKQEIQSADLFVNNANIGDSQLQLIESTLNTVPMMIVIGNGLHHYTEYGTFDYIEHKQKLFNSCKKSIASVNNSTKILHLGLTFLPNTNVDQENYISWKQMFRVIDEWIDNPVFWDISYNWKATDSITTKLKKIIPNLKDIS